MVERYFGREVALNTATQLEYQGTGWMHPDSNAGFAGRPVATPDRAVCPVCEMQVSRSGAITRVHSDMIRNFCGEWCADRFASRPRAFQLPALLNTHDPYLP